MKRTEINPLPAYFDRYILLCNEEFDHLQALQKSIDDLYRLPIQQWKAIDSRVYAPNKWAIKDILQHLIDTERIFTYRALAFARGDKQHLPPFDEENYATGTNANKRSIEELIEELKTVHHSTLKMFQSFSTEMLLKTGVGFKGEYSVASIGFILPGHQVWHFKIIEERYIPLLDTTTL